MPKGTIKTEESTPLRRSGRRKQTVSYEEEGETEEPPKKGTKKQEAEVKAATKSSSKSSKIKQETEVKPTPKSSSKSTKYKKVANDEALAEDVHVYYELSEKEMKEVNNAFDLNCSTDGEELLSSEDLRTAIRSLGFEPRADEIQNLVDKFSKNGKINRDGFHKIMAFKMGSSPGTKDNYSNDEISRVFNLLDLDKTGMITLDNLKSISKELNEEITEEELHEMIAEADIDGDFQINKEEFYNIMKKTSLY